MNTSSKQCNMHIEVSNYGPIRDAKISLRPLTVFVGPSNTGKSYLAILVYALHKFFSGGLVDRFSFGLPLIRHGRQLSRSGIDDFDYDIGMFEELANWIQSLDNSDSLASNRYELPDHIAALIHPLLQLDDEQNDSLRNEVARCFGLSDTAGLTRFGADSEARVSVICEPSNHLKNGRLLSLDFDLSTSDFEPSEIVSKGPPLELNYQGMQELIHTFRIFNPAPRAPWPDNLLTILSGELAGLVRSTMVAPLDQRAYYLPADRTGVMHAHQVVAASIISALPLAGLRASAKLPSVSGVLSDFLVQLLSISRNDSWALDGTVQQSHASQIERQMLGGAVHSELLATNYPIFSYQPDGWGRDIPLTISSSMVSELAPVVLYLRHVVEPGDVLIIEEPESHLHPGMQVEFVRQLAAIVKSGIRVILTTHSEWVLEELANLMRLADLDEDKRADIEGAEGPLSQFDVGVWLFESKGPSNGSVVEELPLDLHDGGFASGYEEVARRTYNKWATISNRIEEEETN